MKEQDNWDFSKVKKAFKIKPTWKKSAKERFWDGILIGVCLTAAAMLLGKLIGTYL